MTALLKQKRKYGCSQPEIRDIGCSPKDRHFIGRKMICLSEQQRNSASQRKKQCCSGNGNPQPLWLVAENDQDEREYLSLRSLLSYRLKIFIY